MATSGTQTFSETRDQIIFDAYQMVGVYGIGRTVSAEDMEVANRVLNKMIKAWGAKGLHLWTKEEGVLFLQPSTASYTIGSSYHATLTTNLRLHYITSSAANGASSIVLDSGTDVVVADYIGVVLSDKTVHWTTVASKAGSTITLTAALTGAAGDNATVYVYTNRLYKPLKILNARYILNTAGTDGASIILSPIAHQTYYDIAIRSSDSQPNQYFYNPDLTTGSMNLWPRPSDGAGRVEFTFERIIEDMTTATDDFDFPSEWLETITYQLAWRLCTYFGKAQKGAQLIGVASQMLDDLLDWDSEITTVEFQPDTGDN